MKYTKRFQDSFINRMALQYWRNVISNFDDKVDYREFFDFFERCDVHRKAIRRVRETFREQELEAIGYGIKGRVQSGNLSETLFELWNERAQRDKCRSIILEVTDGLLRDQKRGPKGETEKRLDYVAKVFGLSPVERDVLAFAFITDVCGMKTPYMHCFESMAKVNLMAMAIDCSFEEVRRAVGSGGNLRRFDCMKSDFDIEHDPVGDYLGGSDIETLEGKFYTKVTGEVLPWPYFGELAEKDGAFLKRLMASNDGQGGMNILLYGEPGTGKTSFAKCLAHELGFDAYEVLQGAKDERQLCVESRIVGIKLGNERLSRHGAMLIVDEADEILRTDRFGFGLQLGNAHGSEKGVVNDILDGVRLPMVWIVNTPAQAMDPSVRRRFDFSICFHALSLRQREMVWRNNVKKYGLGKLITDAQIRQLADRYETSAGGISTVARNFAKLKPKKSEVMPVLTQLIEPHCALVGASRLHRSDAPVENYSIEGLNISNGLPLDRIVESVRGFYEANKDGLNARHPRLNILLWGPPGTGKTEFAKYLASEAGHKLKVKMGSDLLSMWVGGTEHNLASVFKDAEEDGSILFLDEIDGLVQARGRADHSWEVTQVNELLHQMENFNGVLISATNFFDNLDPAIMRRFTFKVQFDFLDDDGKRLLFERTFATKLTDEEMAMLRRIDHVTPGDMSVAKQNLYYLASRTTNAERIAAIEQEISAKRNYHPKQIGFGQ